MLKNTILANKLIARDETLHAEAGAIQFKRMCAKYGKPEPSVLRGMLDEAINIENEFVKILIGDDTIGQRYGSTIKKYGLMDKLLDGLLNDPFGRRHIVNMFQYADLYETKGLFPCAYETLWSVRKGESGLLLDMTLIQRSNDYLVAGYINKIQYTALLMMVAGHCGYKVGKFNHLVQNLHIYDRHFDGVSELLNKEPIDVQPKLILKENKNFYQYDINDFVILGIENITKINSKLESAV